MIRRIDRYFFRKATITLVIMLVLILLVVIGMDIILKLKLLLESELAPGQSRLGMICAYYLHQLPSLVSPILPFAAIVSVIIATAPSLKRGEFTSLAAAGISLRRSCRSLLWFALLVGAVDVILSDQVAPRIEGRRATLEDALTGTSHTARRWLVAQEDTGKGTAWFARRAILVPGESPRLEDLAIAPPGAGLITARALVFDAAGEWRLLGPIIRTTEEDGRVRMHTIDELACSGDLDLPYTADEFSSELVSHYAMTSYELLARANLSDHGQIYRAHCYNRLVRLVVPLLALLLVLPVFIRFDNRDGLVLASIRSLLAGLVPLGIVAIGGSEAYSGNFGAGPIIGCSLVLACLPGAILYSRWRM